LTRANGSQPIYAGLDLRLRRKERWCVPGANGAGKSTLLKLVAGATEPDQGSAQGDCAHCTCPRYR
jgi:ATPase subunit of ABC transporter with duplicated ATPase domains